MKKITEFLKAIADETRLKILLLLSRQEMAVCELIDVLKLSQPAVSHHLKILKQAGLVEDNREGKWIFYTVDQKNFAKYYKTLEDELFLSIRDNLAKGFMPSPVREKPGLCEELRKRTGRCTGKAV